MSQLDPETKLLIDTGKYNFQVERPLTQYYKDVLVRNTDNFTQFLGYLLFKLCDWDIDTSSFVYDAKNTIYESNDMEFIYKYDASSMRSDMNKFYDMLNGTDRSFKLQHKTMINKFREVKHMGEYCIIFKRNKSNNFYNIDMDKLNKYMKRNYPHFYENICDIMTIYSISNCWINNDSDKEEIE